MGAITGASGVAAPLGLVNLNPATVPLVVKGAASQSVDLQQWQNSVGTNIARLDFTGNMVLTNALLANSMGNTVGHVLLTFTSDNPKFTSFAATNIGLTVKGAASQSADLQQWQDSTGTVLAKVDASGLLRTDEVRANTTAGLVMRDNSGTETIRMTSGTNQCLGPFVPLFADPTKVPIIAKGVVSQSADLQQWQSSTAAVLAKVDSGGGITAANNNFYVSQSGNATLNGSFTFYTPNASTTPLVVRNTSGGTQDLMQIQSSTSAVLARVDSSGAIAPQNGARLTSGSGAPTTPGGINPTAGDWYLRRDGGGAANSNLYLCTVGGATPTWLGIA